MFLKYITDIISGPTLRGTLSDFPVGNVAVLQMKDVSIGDFTITDTPQKISDIGFLPHHFLLKGDVLFLRSGANNYAFYYDGKFPVAVASSLFFILRVRRDDVFPEYIAAFLNQHVAQAKLHPGKAGTSVTNITKAMLEELDIPLPSIEVQKNLVRLHRQVLLEKTISENIIRNKNMLLSGIMANPLKDEAMKIQPDDLSLWDRYVQPTHLIEVKLKSPLILKGKVDPVTSFIGAIIKYEQEQKFYSEGNVKYGYPAIKEWRIVEKFDLFRYNNDTLPQDRPQLENVIPHYMIESMEFSPTVVNI